jgi:hypothetical protein
MTELAINFTGNDEPVPAGASSTSNPLTVVGAATPSNQVQPAQPQHDGSLPEFERATVSSTEIKISGACAIDTHGEVTVSLDDLIRAVGVFRVVKINHYVNKAGDVIRQQVLAPVEDLAVVPFDASNPNDDGIVRARP